MALATAVRKMLARYFHFGIPPSSGRPPSMRLPNTASHSPRSSGATSAGMLLGSYW